jgi:hypothetical protein
VATELRGRFKQLTEAQREVLADYLTARIEYLRAERKHAQLLLDALRSPARGDNKRMRKFVADVLAPSRKRMRACQVAAVAESVDIDVFSELLPAVLGGINQAVDVPMLFSALNVDSDLTDQAMEKVTPMIKTIASRVRQR